MSRTRCHRHVCITSAAVYYLDCLVFSVEAPIDTPRGVSLLLTSVCTGAAKKDDLQEKITSSGREQIESFIGAVSEKITPPAPVARSDPAGHFAPRQVCIRLWIYNHISFPELSAPLRSFVHCHMHNLPSVSWIDLWSVI